MQTTPPLTSRDLRLDTPAALAACLDSIATEHLRERLLAHEAWWRAGRTPGPRAKAIAAPPGGRDRLAMATELIGLIDQARNYGLRLGGADVLGEQRRELWADLDGLRDWLVKHVHAPLQDGRAVSSLEPLGPIATRIERFARLLSAPPSLAEIRERSRAAEEIRRFPPIPAEMIPDLRARMLESSHKRRAAVEVDIAEILRTGSRITQRRRLAWAAASAAYRLASPKPHDGQWTRYSLSTLADLAANVVELDLYVRAANLAQSKLSDVDRRTIDQQVLADPPLEAWAGKWSGDPVFVAILYAAERWTSACFAFRQSHVVSPMQPIDQRNLIEAMLGSPYSLPAGIVEEKDVQLLETRIERLRVRESAAKAELEGETGDDAAPSSSLGKKRMKRLTKTELVVIALKRDLHAENKEIADRVGCSPGLVSNVRVKLGNGAKRKKDRRDVAHAVARGSETGEELVREHGR